MYKQVGLAILVIAPLVADFASRHTQTPANAAPVAVEGLPPGAIEVRNPNPHGEGPPPAFPAQPMTANMIQNGQMQTVPGLGAGIDPMPSLDPTPGGSSPSLLPPTPQPEVAAPAPQFIAAPTPSETAVAAGPDAQAAPPS